MCAAPGSKVFFVPAQKENQQSHNVQLDSSAFRSIT